MCRLAPSSNTRGGQTHCVQRLSAATRDLTTWRTEEKEPESSIQSAATHVSHTCVAKESDDMRAVPPDEASRGLARACGDHAARWKMVAPSSVASTFLKDTKAHDQANPRWRRLTLNCIHSISLPPFEDRPSCEGTTQYLHIIHLPIPRRFKREALTTGYARYDHCTSITWSGFTCRLTTLAM